MIKLNIPELPCEYDSVEYRRRMVGDYFWSPTAEAWIEAGWSSDSYLFLCVTPKKPKTIHHPLLRPGVWVSMDKHDREDEIVWICKDRPSIRCYDLIYIANTNVICSMSWEYFRDIIPDNFEQPFIAQVV